MTKATPYHPDSNPALPPVKTVADIETLPWGGNAWWDLPILSHVNRAMFDESIAKPVRQEMAERAGYLMTGEECTFNGNYDFDDYLSELPKPKA